MATALVCIGFRVPVDYTKNNASYTKLDQEADEKRGLTATANEDEDEDAETASIYGGGGSQPPDPKRVDMRSSGGEVVSPTRK